MSPTAPQLLESWILPKLRKHRRPIDFAHVCPCSMDLVSLGAAATVFGASPFVRFIGDRAQTLNQAFRALTNPAPVARSRPPAA
jgi:hypothetical protein